MSADDRGEARVPLRYEDVTQDGRVQLEALTQGVGAAVWLAIVERRGMARPMIAAGVIPVLARLVVEATDECVGVAPLRATGTLQLSHSKAPDGSVDRLFFNAWVDLEGRRGRTNRPPPPGAGEIVRVGRVFAEHVFTRPWGAPEERSVRSLGFPGYPEVPPAQWDFRALEASAEAPADGVMLDPDPVVDEVSISFGLSHTDSNQHVNSLVYLRLFEEAAARRRAMRGDATPRLMRWIEVGYRKPFFAGEAARIRLQTFDRDRDVGACGVFVAGDARDGHRPHAYVRAGFRA